MNLTGGAFSSIAAGATMSEAKVARLRMSLLGVQAAVGGVLAVLGTRFLAGAYDSAGKFQLAMTNVGIAAGATATQVRSLSREVINLSNTTAQSAVTTAQQYAIIARSGLNNPAQLSALGPEIVKFADVQQYLSGANPVTTSKQATQLVHLFQAYTPKTMGPLLDEVNRLMMMQPEDLSRVVRQAAYFVPIAHGMGMSDAESIEIMAAMGRTGLLLGKGGTGAANTILGGINAVTMTQHLASAKIGALEQLGVIDPNTGKNIMFDAHGHVTLLPMLQKLASERGSIDAAGGPGTFMNDLIKGFGLQGGRFLATMATPVMMQQLAIMQPELFGSKALPGVVPTWEQYVKTLPFLTAQFQTNLNNLGLVLATPSMGLVISGIGKLVTSLGSMVQFFEAHPNMANLVMGGIAAGTVGAGVLSVAALLGMARLGLRGLFGGGAAITNPALQGVLDTTSAFPLASRWPSIIGSGGGPAGAGLGGIGSVLLRLGGIVTAVISGLMLFEHLPDIGVAIYNWWARSKDGIAYNIGYAFGWITRMLINGAQNLASVATAAFGAIFSSQAMSAAIYHSLTGQGALVGADFAAAVNQSITNAGGLATAPKGSMGHYLGKGWSSGLGVPNAVHIHGGIHIHASTNDPKKLSDMVIKHIVRSLPHAIGATGGAMGSSHRPVSMHSMHPAGVN